MWNIFWITNFVILLGLGLDTTSAMNAKAKLQHAADTASHGGAISVIFSDTGAINSALIMGQHNIPHSTAAIQSADISVGFWDENNRDFLQGYPFNNAVKVLAERTDARGNPVIGEFLRAIGLQSWTIEAFSIAQYDVDSNIGGDCVGGGAVMGADIDLAAQNTFTGDLCVYAQDSFKITQGNIITCDVEMALHPDGSWVTGTPPIGVDLGDESYTCNTDYFNLTNVQMIGQVFEYRPRPLLARTEFDNVECYMLQLFGPFNATCADTPLGSEQDPFNAIPPYINRTEVITVTSFNNKAKKGVTATGTGNSLMAGTLYKVECSPSGQAIDAGGILQNIGIYTTDCIIQPKRDKDVSVLKPTKTPAGQNKTQAAVCAELLDDPNANSEECNNVVWEMEIVHQRFGCTRENDYDATENANPGIGDSFTITYANNAVSFPNHPLHPNFNGDTSLPAGYSYDPDLNTFVDANGVTGMYFEPYQTMLDTVGTEEYKLGVLEFDDIVDDRNGTELCAVEPGSTLLWDNVFVFNSYIKNDNPGLANIVLPNNSQLGRIDGCREGGGVRVYSASSFSTPSGTTIHGSHFTILDDVNIAAKMNGVWGLSIESMGEIKVAAQGLFGGCDPQPQAFAADAVRTARPVAIVN